jgi:hypothetical protein
MVTPTAKEIMKITEHDAITNTSLDREMTETENQEFQARQAKVAAAKTETEAAETAKAAAQAKLAALGLTTDDLKALGL